MTIQTFTGTLTIVDCAACHMAFGVAEHFERVRRDDHKTFYCPAGHENFWPQKSEAEKLRARLASAEASLVHTRDQLQATEYQRRAQKGQNTRLKNRISAGVCPCCSRSFQDLRRHMAGQHPDFKEQSK
ncbi:hypothetical protein [Microbacterium sp.]|uniref:hypothetical protein n=1 Tax=Microbacterium sp. TaxID=51671 RepID=UPI003242D5A7